MSAAPDRYADNDLAGVRFAGRTDVGHRRLRNEDSMLVRHPVFLVADGMGGHEHGERASASALEAFDALVGETPASIQQVEAIIDALPDRVLEAAGGAGGTTLTGAILVDIDGRPHWYVLNIGDSRTYLAWRGQLEQVSVDHSVVQESIDAGTISRTEADRHPRRNVITRAIGVGGDSRVDSWLLPLERGQRLLVCSDGLSGVVDDAALRQVLFSEASVAQASRRLVDLALEAGGPDNISAVIVEVDHVADCDGELEQTGSGVDQTTNPRSFA